MQVSTSAFAYDRARQPGQSLGRSGIERVSKVNYQGADSLIGNFEWSARDPVDQNSLAVPHQKKDFAPDSW